MAKRFEDRYGRGGNRRDRDRADDRGYDSRGYMDRAGDEVRSWFGDDEAEHRRRMDEQRDRARDYRPDHDRYNERGRGWSTSSGRRPSGAGGPENWRGRDADDQSRFRDWSGTWAPTDWDRQRSMDSGRESRDWNRGSDRGWGERGGYMGVSGDDDMRRSYEFRDREWRQGGQGAPNRDWQSPRQDWSSRNEWSPRDDMSGRHEHSRNDWSVDEGRTSFGPHRGRGPKGYQRADSRIHEDVCDRLTYSDVDAENVEVRVENGEVTLSGTVRNRWDKRRAEDIAEEISGVRDVHNHIRVHREDRDRGIGQSDKSVSDQPGTVLGVNPTADANITSGTPASTAGNTDTAATRNRR